MYFSFFQFFRDGCIAMYFPLRTAFAVSQRFWMVVSSFSFVSMHLLNSSLISWLNHSSFSRMLFNLHVVEFLPNFFLWLSSSFKALWSEICRGQSQSFGIGWDLICDPVCGLFWRKFHVHLRRMCIQFYSDGKFCICLWNLFGPVYHLRPFFLWWCCA